MKKNTINKLNGKKPEEVKNMYESFLANPTMSGVTYISNYKKAYLKDEIKMALKKACGSDNLYAIIDVNLLNKALNELAVAKEKYKNDKTTRKRYSDCNSYLKKYIQFIENCEVSEPDPSSGNGNIGYCYIITNPAFPEFYIKIGSTQNINQRLKDLFNTSVPLPFTLYASLETNRYKQAEKLMHSLFKSSRLKENREFFWLNPEVALESLKSIADSMGAIVFVYDEDGNVKRTFDYRK